MQKGREITRGKTKVLYEAEGQPDLVVVQQMDAITAGGRQTGVVTSERRPTTIWIDKDAGVIRKVLLEPQEGSPAKLIDLTTYAVEPSADPDLPDERFTFTPPA